MADWTVATWNVNSIRSRLPLLLEWLHRSRTDVLCVQETKCQDQDFPQEEFRQAGYHVVYRGEKSYNGVAIIARSEPADVRFGLPGKNPDETRLIAATVDGIPLVNTYVPQGRDPESEHFQYKLSWFDRLLDFFRKNFSPEKPLLWVGDLNVAPEPQDVYDPKALLGHVDFHPAVHQKFQELLAWGFVDVFRKHVPTAGQYTFWDYRVPKALERGIGWRVDHILATPSLAEKSISAAIDPGPRKAPKPSDHTPLTVTFSLRTSRK